MGAPTAKSLETMSQGEKITDEVTEPVIETKADEEVVNLSDIPDCQEPPPVSEAVETAQPEETAETSTPTEEK